MPIPRKSSQQAEAFAAPEQLGKEELPKRSNRAYPLFLLQPGQSYFFPKPAGYARKEQSDLRRQVRTYNLKYNAFYAMIIHVDQIEVARIK